VTIQTPQAGSMFGIFFSDKTVTNYDESVAANQEQFKRFFAAMLEQGIYLAPSQFETLFMSAVHTDEDLARTLEAAEKSFEALR
ncbi:MAG: aspartate aminotransferase family protein, partial [Selenomonadaceae bacterium]|nr:aspartate aminotransferase family protein [Selenomonadaceae bacterium]